MALALRDAGLASHAFHPGTLPRYPHIGASTVLVIDADALNDQGAPSATGVASASSGSSHVLVTSALPSPVLCSAPREQAVLALLAQLWPVGQSPQSPAAV